MCNEYRSYRVTLRFQFPAWDEKEGIPCEVSARNKRDAIRFAKMNMERDGHLPSHGKGRVTLTAEEIEESNFQDS